MSKVKSIIFLALLLALVNIATSTRLRVSYSVSTKLRLDNETAKTECPRICTNAGYRSWNGNWKNFVSGSGASCSCKK